MSRSEVRMQKARDLRDKLRDLGEFSEAQVIDDLINSMKSARTALKQLHADNLKLRKSS